MNASQPRKVLVIDDEPEVADLIREILRAHQYEAIATTQWTDAMDALAHEQPDLMLMDLNMPTIDGLALLKFVREQGYDVPVIVVSGFISDDMRKKLDPLHVCSYVEKPFEVQDLAAEIATVLRQHRSRKSMKPLKAPLLNRIFRRRIAHYVLIDFICLILAGLMVVISERSDEISGQYKNPPAEIP